MESPATETVTTTISFDCELELSKKRGWVDSNIFHLDCAPEVNFKVSAYINYRNTRVNIKVSKSEVEVAYAIVKITVPGTPTILEDVSGWKDAVYFQDVSIPANSDICSKLGLNCNPADSDEHVYQIKINCSIIWFGFIDDLRYSEAVYSNIQKYCTVESSDIKIKVEDTDFLAHKFILRTESKVFEKMLAKDVKLEENCIYLSDLEVDVIKELLLFIYYGKLQEAVVDNELTLKLFKAASVYQLSKLKNVCALLLSNKLTFDNVKMLMKIGTLYNSSILRQRAIAYIINNRLEFLCPDDL
ncbi:uncharacterized protein LOC103573788 [Microplitis demolitor]|uniref:uncharacterized protein LOC103573788 n=1 Tax=Microplitis demolitor TaxID=69319 RepID=UPI0004CDB185|nr:uncharacterized protein LOC103573788 [Microplitis demolitor]